MTNSSAPKDQSVFTPVCRSCNNALKHTLINLGATPIANNLVDIQAKNSQDPHYPLHVYICHHCWLAQVPAFTNSIKLFTDTYTYFSSYSTTWLNHAQQYVLNICKTLRLNKNSFIVEIASNDGYLLQYVKELGIPHIGIEPCNSVAQVALAKGIPTVQKFFGIKTAKEVAQRFGKADLIIGNNVYAHVPDIHDFTAGMKYLLKENGTITLEFQYLPNLIKNCEFDTIYHEHYSYFSLTALNTIIQRHKLKIWNVEMLPTHGGSIRVYLTHVHNTFYSTRSAVNKLFKREEQLGVNTLTYYQTFQKNAEETKALLRKLIQDIKKSGKRIAAYGAPAKGNTLLNYCNMTNSDIEFTVDKNPFKQNRLLPGSRIPVLHPSALVDKKPDYILVLPWNLQEEIIRECTMVQSGKVKFIIPIPKPVII